MIPISETQIGIVSHDEVIRKIKHIETKYDHSIMSMFVNLGYQKFQLFKTKETG